MWGNLMVFCSFCWISVCAVLSYLLGSINFAVLVSKRFGSRKDIRELGSRNAGFSNCLRNFGFGPSAFTFLGDFLKGVLSMLITYYTCKGYECRQFSFEFFLTLSQLFCCIGHMFPCLFQFRGGKGILTAWACIFFINWKIAIILILIFLLSLFLLKIISLSSILCAMAYPILMFTFDSARVKNLDILPFTISMITSTLVLIRHAGNIKRIVNRSEPKISFRGKS